jgi:AcrR family transcriptional regulator
VEQIAARSGVSKPTVFASVGSKRDVIKRLREEAMAGDEEPVRPGAPACYWKLTKDCRLRST